MTIEVSLLISGISMAFAVFMGIVNAKRNHKADVKADTVTLTTVMVKLESIGVGIAKIENKVTNVEGDTKENRERIIKAEESTKQAHRRIDALEKKANNE